MHVLLSLSKTALPHKLRIGAFKNCGEFTPNARFATKQAIGVIKFGSCYCILISY